MDSVARIGSIPLVETGLKTAENIYFRMKNSNVLFSWGLNTMETTLFGAIDSLKPGLKVFEGTINRFDLLVCKSLDLMEQRVPNVYLPPQMMYYNTKEYMSDRLVRPVLKRANSLKEIGHVVLDSKVTNFAADRLDGALIAADKYVERYLPNPGEKEEGDDDVDASNAKPGRNQNSQNESAEIHVIQTFHRGQKFSKKLKRRLTHRTISEAAALKKQSKEAIHILLYATELILTDPKEALNKTRELWTYLSENEPENQARPETLEQLLVLLTRETARRLVHFANFTRDSIGKIPDSVKHTRTEMIHHFLFVTDSLVKITGLNSVKDRLLIEISTFKERIAGLYDEVQSYTTARLERLAVFVSGRLEEEKSSMRANTNQTTNNNNNNQSNHLNGAY